MYHILKRHFKRESRRRPSISFYLCEQNHETSIIIGMEISHETRGYCTYHQYWQASKALQTDFIIYTMEKKVFLGKLKVRKKYPKTSLSEQGTPMLSHQDSTST